MNQSQPHTPTDQDARKAWPAWLMSAFFHGLTLLLLGLFVQTTPRGTRAEVDRHGGIVLTSSTANKTEYFSEDDATAEPAEIDGSVSDAQPSPTDAVSEAVATLPTASQADALSAGLPQLPGPGEVAPPGDGLLGSGGELTAGQAPSRSVGGETTTGVFGVSGTGSKFVFVFDRSGSMEGFGGRPLAAAKRELRKSILSLGSTHQFQIIFYNERTSIFNPNHPNPPRLLFGEDRNKKLAERFIEGIVATGGTSHLDALSMAVRMGPDVVFFLTDAAEPRLTRDELNTVRRLNRTGASINSIEFGAGPSPGNHNFLMTLAEENGGKHVYVDITRLPFGGGN